MADRDACWLISIFKPFEPLVGHPERIAVVAGIFVIGYLLLRSSGRFRAWPMLVAAVAWGSWVPWEWFAKVMKYDIRVDLLLLCPLLIGVTLWSLVASFWLKSWSKSRWP